MLNRTILATFLATSAIALAIDPAVAKRMVESRVECPTRDMPERRFDSGRVGNSGCAVRLRRAIAQDADELRVVRRIAAQT